MIETGKIMGQMDHLIKGHQSLGDEIRGHVSKVDGLTWKAIAAFIVVFIAGFAAVVWANGRFEHQDQELSELAKNVAVMQSEASATHDDIKDIKNAVVNKDGEKAAH